MRFAGNAVFSRPVTPTSVDATFFKALIVSLWPLKCSIHRRREGNKFFERPTPHDLHFIASTGELISWRVNDEGANIYVALAIDAHRIDRFGSVVQERLVITAFHCSTDTELCSSIKVLRDLVLVVPCSKDRRRSHGSTKPRNSIAYIADASADDIGVVVNRVQLATACGLPNVAIFRNGPVIAILCPNQMIVGYIVLVRTIGKA